MKYLAVALVLSISLLGCSHTESDSTVTTTPNGETVTTKGNGEVSVDSKDGKTTMSADGKSLKIDGPDGSASMGGSTTVTEKDLGIPFYPGSEESPGTAVKIEKEGERDYMMVRTSTDAPSKVGEFYKDKLKDVKSSSVGDVTYIEGMADNGNKVAIAAQSKDGKTVINCASSFHPKK